MQMVLVLVIMKVEVQSGKPIAEGLFAKYSTLGFDVVADHAWVDDTVLCVWISCFCIGLIGRCIVKYETGERLHSVAGSLQFATGRCKCIAGVHCVGTIGQSGLFLTSATSSWRNIQAAFEDVYPAGSIYVDRYYYSWDVAVPCRSFNETCHSILLSFCDVALVVGCRGAAHTEHRGRVPQREKQLMSACLQQVSPGQESLKRCWC